MNTEPDEYYCACPQGYSGKDCQIGQPRGGWDTRPLPSSPVNVLRSEHEARDG